MFFFSFSFPKQKVSRLTICSSAQFWFGLSHHCSYSSFSRSERQKERGNERIFASVHTTVPIRRIFVQSNPNKMSGGQISRKFRHNTHTHTHSLTHMCVSLVRLIQSAKRERSNYMCAPHLTLTRSLDGFAIWYPIFPETCSSRVCVYARERERVECVFRLCTE